ncbi:MAG: 4-alpha-glucanotransferase [Clostridia bacterium]|nr:4-alpha-glucanotransferase [Clostridia bacterium]
MKRASGVLMHISSLWGSDSIGCFGKEALEFVDFLADSGFAYWQILPLCMADECNSPYKSYSAFGGNPYFVDLRQLADSGHLTTEELKSARQDTPYVCEYAKLGNTRMELLRTASKRASDSERREILNFISNDKYIAEFCEFMARRAANDNKPWRDWTTDTVDGDELFAWQFIQYHFFAQWKKVRGYANSKGIKIIGDIPIYVSYDSADVWANLKSGIFDLDDEGNMNSVAGCPPDYFAEDGQLWGNPLYNWNNMKDNGYRWWCDRIDHMLDMFDGVRIDHFRGLESYWSIPADAKTAREGKWLEGPGLDFVNTIKDVARSRGGENLIIAEDLGEITPAVKKLVDDSGFPGMRVFQFAFLGDRETPHLPHNYNANCVAYTGTHDNNTLLGSVWEMSEGQRREMLEYCGYRGQDWNSRESYEVLIQTMLRSHAGIVILPIQDLLLYGADTRMNTPGTASGNWEYRLTKLQLEEIDKAKFKHYNYIYGRS